MSSRVSRKQSQARTREALIAAGAAAFRRHGYHQASAEAIAAGAGYTRGALYANFAGKEGLFLAVMEREFARRFETLSKAANPDAFARLYVKAVDEDPDWSLALLEFTIYAARTPTLREDVIASNKRLRMQTARVLRAANPDLSAAEAASAARLVSVIQSGVSLERALDREGVSARDIAPALWRSTKWPDA
jgi:AcrR family transcriptional regulator